MEQQSQRFNPDRQRKKLKKVRRRRVFMTVLVALVLLIGGYVLFQYYSGKNSSGTNSDFANKDLNFNGIKDKNGKVNTLLIGIDAREGETKSRSDTIMISQYDPDTGEVKLVSLMRDMFVRIPGYKDYKINTANYLGGPELLRQTIKQDFGIDVQYYTMIDFKGFEKTIDALAPDGIKINVEKAMSKNIGVSLQPGVQKLHGKELLGYARFRHDAEGDFGRVRRQQQVMNAVKDQILSVNGITKAPKMFGAVQPYINTNISSFNGLALAKDLLLKHPDKIDTLTLPVQGSYTNGYSSYDGAILQIDEEKNAQAVQSFLGEDSSSN